MKRILNGESKQGRNKSKANKEADVRTSDGPMVKGRWEETGGHLDKEIFKLRLTITNEAGQRAITEMGKRPRDGELGTRSGAGSGMWVGWRVPLLGSPLVTGRRRLEKRTDGLFD